MSQAHVSLGLIVTMTTTAVQCQPENARVFSIGVVIHMTAYRGIPMANCWQACVFRATSTRKDSLDRRKTREKSISSEFYRKDATR